MGDSFLSDPSRKRKRSKVSSTTRDNTRNSRDKNSRNLRGNSTRNGNINRNSRDEQDEGDDITSESETDGATSEREVEEMSSDEEFEGENAADKRRRLAKQYLENLQTAELEDDEFDAKDLDNDIVGRRLQRDVAESKGHVYKFFGNKISSQIEDIQSKITRIGSKSVTALDIHYPFLYTVSKDIELIKWNIEGKPNRVKHTRGGFKYYNLHDEQHRNHHYDAIFCVAASPDGKFIVTGGNDGRLIIWSSENLACLKVLETRCAVNSITFRRNSDQLYAACADLKVRTYSINQFAQLETLYGHQDNIVDIASLTRETCVSVGSRDKTALFWKIADESRLTFRGGDSDKVLQKTGGFAEGAIECVSMTDESHFITGLDNGNVSLWSLAKKKPMFTERSAHGIEPQLSPEQASAETTATVPYTPKPVPYWITSVYSVPFSDIFITGSYNGSVKVWRISQEGLRNFLLIGTVEAKGCVVGISSVEVNKKLVVYILTSKEHKFGRWQKVGRNSLVSFAFNI